MFEKKKASKKNIKSAVDLLAELDAQIITENTVNDSVESKPLEEVEVAEVEIKVEKQPINKKNGHKSVNIAKETIDIKSETEKQPVAIVSEVEQSIKLAEQERKLAERNAMIEADTMRRFYESIPGYGYLFGIKDEFLPESTNIDKGQALTLALGYMGEDMLDPTRKISLFVSFAGKLMRLQNSVDGKSRTDVLEARRQEAEKAAAGAVRDGLAGGR